MFCSFPKVAGLTTESCSLHTIPVEVTMSVIRGAQSAQSECIFHADDGRKFPYRYEKRTDSLHELL